MVTIPKVTHQDLQYWFKLQQQLSKLKSEEAMLRARIFSDLFPDPQEGTNNYDIGDGTGAVLKATHVINRSVDQGSLEALDKAMRDPASNLPKLPLRKLINWEPKLVIKEYRALTDEERAAFDQCLIIKEGSPQMKIEIPKRARRS